jgi:hypothetical protein
MEIIVVDLILVIQLSLVLAVAYMLSLIPLPNPITAWIVTVYLSLILLVHLVLRILLIQVSKMSSIERSID